jgi:hypothetical protein
MIHTTAGGSSALPTNKQIKEDFSDIIYNVTPTETPFYSLCKRSSTKNTEVGWFLDKLTDAKNYASGGDAAPFAEGADMASDGHEVVKRVMNVTQIFQKAIVTSETMEAVDLYGRASELAYQMTKKAQELKRDIETTLMSSAHGMSGGAHSCMIEDTTNVGGAITESNNAVRQFSNLKAQLDANPFGHASGGPVYDDTANLSEPLDDKKMNAIMQQSWDIGGKTTILICNGTIANQLAEIATSGGTGMAGRFRETGNLQKLVHVVDIFVSPFGEVRVALDRFLNRGETGPRLNDFFLIDPEYIECCYLREPKTVEIAKTGDSEKRMLATEFTFKALAPDGLMYVKAGDYLDEVA